MLWSEMERLGRVFDPWSEFERMNRTLRRFALPSTVEFPAINMWVSENNAVVTTEVPGIDPNALEISVVKDSLTLRVHVRMKSLKKGSLITGEKGGAESSPRLSNCRFLLMPARLKRVLQKGSVYISSPCRS